MQEGHGRAGRVGVWASVLACLLTWWSPVFALDPALDISQYMTSGLGRATDLS